ncbi:MAG: hypothetical protein Q4G41_06495 [Coriobacteriales bacterium]|jgi:hypothetical protein|nr:hypothetical protein [Coriobacteriales bacterium]MDO5709750.1 hypothetical protein [Coriobacteriales bacterium]
MSFVTAIPIAIKVAGYLKEGYDFVKEHPEEVQQAMDEAAKAANAARKFAIDAKDQLQIDERMAQARNAAEQARQFAADQARAITAGRTGNTEEKKAQEEAERAEAEAAKVIKQARQTILESADLRTTIPKLVERLGTSNDEELMKYMQILDSPGCFVIATYGKLDLDKDLTDFHGVYVANAETVGEGIALAISRAGCPDVYADIKYKQNVVIYVFNCAANEMKYRTNALIEAMGAIESYNMPLK